jgi:hypothetical protein
VSTDARVMDRTTEQLRALVWCMENAQDKAGAAVVPFAGTDHLIGFSTSMTDDDRRYLDLCAELYARGEYEPRLPGGASA